MRLGEARGRYKGKTAMARKTAAEAARTRRTILDSAAELFSRQGVADTTLAQIAQGAAVTRGAIYWHFKDKGDLLKTLFSEHTLPLEQGAPESADFEDRWQRLREHLIETLCGKEPRRLSEIMIHQGACGVDATVHQQRLAHVRMTFMRQIQVLLSSAVLNGELNAALDIEKTLDFFQFCITGLLFECLQNSDDPIAAIASTLATLRHIVQSPPAHLLLTSAPISE